MGKVLTADHGENGLYFSNIEWGNQETRVFMNYYKNRAVSGDDTPELYGIFRFFASGDNGLGTESGEIVNWPWDGDPHQFKDLGKTSNVDVLEMGDVPDRSYDAVLMTVQEAPWTSALQHHVIRLTLDGFWSADFDVYFPEPLHAINWTGTWSVFQDYR